MGRGLVASLLLAVLGFSAGLRKHKAHVSNSSSQTAASYWSGVDLNSKSALRSRLRDGSRQLSYGNLWTMYQDVWVNLPGKCRNSVFDIYSNKCWTPGTTQCGSYRREGDCYNREHSWPKSWWGGNRNSAYTDVFHVFPSDGYVNSRRSAFPFGAVSRPTFTSRDGHKLGPCTTSGFSGTCFEPVDSMKGLLARAHLFMATRYSGEFGCCNRDAVFNADLKPWTRELVLKWNADHPPEAWEVELNDRLQGWQGNRNPYIDHPNIARSIF